VTGLHENGNGAATCTVALVVDEPDLADRIDSALADGGLQSTGSWATVEDCLDAAPTGADVVVIALADDSRDGLDLQAVSAHHGGAPVVMVVAEVGRRAQRALMRLGAHAIVVVTDVDRALVHTVGAVRAGQVVVPSALRFQFETPVLSYREKQVLGLVVMGFTNAEIAAKLFLAESTVKSHLSSAFEKLGVRSRREAAELIVDGSSGFGSGILTITEPAGRAVPSA
jgi:DNA-binding NarL/FixJ family response regulator